MTNFSSTVTQLSVKFYSNISVSASITHATLLIENGADVKDVQTRLGHTNIETTLQTYVHDTEKMVKRSVDLFEQVTQAKTS